MKTLFKQLTQSDFNRNVAKVFTGNIVGSFIYALSIPVVARLFDKDAFGNFQLMLSVVAVFSPIVSWRFEKSIILGSNDGEINKSIVLSFITLAFSLIVLALTFGLGGNLVFTYLKTESISAYYPLILCSILLEGVLVILAELAIKQKRITEFSFNKALSLILYGALPVLLAVISKSFTTLFVSRIIAYVISIAYLFIKLKPLQRFRINNFSDVVYWARYHSKFPLYSMPAALINNISIELPVFMLFSSFGVEVVGIYSMAYRLIQMPMSVIESSITDIYFREAAETYNNKGNLMHLYKRTLLKLGIIGLIPALVLPVLPFAIGFFLGPQWEQAGLYIQILYPFILFSFLNSSVAATLVVLRKQELGLILIAVSIVGRFLSMKFFDGSATSMLLAFSISSAIFYIAYNFTIYLSIRKAMYEKTIA